MNYLKVVKDTATIYLRLSGTGPEQVEATDTKTEFRYANTTAPFYGEQAPKAVKDFLAQVSVVNSPKQEPVEESKAKGKK